MKINCKKYFKYYEMIFTLDPWTVRLWTRTVVALLNVLPQTSHSCGRLLEWT